MIIDMAQGIWREASSGGEGDRVQIFDGMEIFRFEDGGEEFVRVKHGSKDAPPAPGAYAFREFDWKRTKEVMKQPCGFVENDHDCVVFQLSVKSTAQIETTAAIVKIDTVTGLLVGSRIQQAVNRTPGRYVTETTYALKRLSVGAPSDPGWFELPSNLHEVRELSRWDAKPSLISGSPANRRRRLP
jgi:hypothetical protein